MARFWNVVTLIVIGVIIADLVANSKGTATVFNGLGALWGTSVNGMLGYNVATQAHQ